MLLKIEFDNCIDNSVNLLLNQSFLSDFKQYFFS